MNKQQLISVHGRWPGLLTLTLSKLVCLSCVLVMCLSLAACSNQPGGQKQGKVIKLGTLSTIEPLISALRDELVATGYKAEVVVFDANNMPSCNRERIL